MPKRYDTDDIYAHAFAQHLASVPGSCAAENPRDAKDRVAAALYHRITNWLPALRDRLSILEKQHGQGSSLVRKYAEYVRRAEALRDRQVNQLRNLSNPTPAKVVWYAGSSDILASYEVYEQDFSGSEQNDRARVAARAYKRLIENGYKLKPLEDLDSRFMLDEIVEACLRWYEVGQPVPGRVEISQPNDHPGQHEAASNGGTRTSEPASRSDVDIQKSNARQKKLEWLARAMLLVREHPEWSDAEIARQVGVNKSQLSRSQEYRTGTKFAREARTPTGTKSKGDLEAVDEDSLNPTRKASQQSEDEEALDRRIDEEIDADRNAKRNAKARKRL